MQHLVWGTHFYTGLWVAEAEDLGGAEKHSGRAGATVFLNLGLSVLLFGDLQRV